MSYSNDVAYTRDIFDKTPMVVAEVRVYNDVSDKKLDKLVF